MMNTMLGRSDSNSAAGADAAAQMQPSISSQFHRAEFRSKKNASANFMTRPRMTFSLIRYGRSPASKSHRRVFPEFASSSQSISTRSS